MRGPCIALVHPLESVCHPSKFLALCCKCETCSNTSRLQQHVKQHLEYMKGVEGDLIFVFLVCVAVQEHHAQPAGTAAASC